MAARKSPRRARRESTERTTSNASASEGFTAEERAAAQDRVRELRAARTRAPGADESSEVLARLATMTPRDRAMGERIHAIITAAAPSLTPRLWYGMPAYARNGKVLCFFQGAQKFKTRYATLGFSDQAALDDGQMWPTAFALKDLTAADEAKIIALVKRAVG